MEWARPHPRLAKVHLPGVSPGHALVIAAPAGTGAAIGYYGGDFRKASVMKAARWRSLLSLDWLGNTLTLRRLEWVGILAPLAFVVLYHYLMLGPGHALFHSLSGGWL